MSWLSNIPDYIFQIPKSWYQWVNDSLRYMNSPHITITRPNSPTATNPMLLTIDNLNGVPGLLADAQTPLAHASDHERAGDDEIDGDHLDIDFTPTNYTPDTTPAEASDVDHLAAHLYGIDQAIGSAVSGGLDFDDDEGDPESVDATAAADGTSEHAARRDHRHQLGAHATEHQSAGGDPLDFLAGVENDLNGEGDGFLMFDDSTDTVSTVAPDDASTAFPKYLRKKSDGSWEIDDLCDLNGVSNGDLPFWSVFAPNVTLRYLAIDENGGKYLRVKSDESGMEWADGLGVQAGTARGQLCLWDTTDSRYEPIASQGTAGQVLTSGGAGAAPTFAGYSLPAPGTTLYKCLTVTAANTWGVDYLRAH